MNRIDFSEIKNWEQFEDLTAEYFNEIRHLEGNNLTEVFVEPVGKGADGGRDILLTFRFHDSIIPFERKWVVQCKFYETLKKSHLDKINISILIEEYRADGYLLICKNSTSNGVTTTFENLRKNCRRNYNYVIWNGSSFINKLYKTNGLQEHYFPEFFDFKTRRAKVTGVKDILSQ